VNEAIRLSPRDPWLTIWLGYIGVANLSLGRFDEAVDNLSKSVELGPKSGLPHFLLAAAFAFAGRRAEAAAACASGKRLTPDFSIAKYRAEARSDHPIYLAFRERLYARMCEAGVPEG
jgi:tetratricopeptide (TPR) repeat protein